MGALAPLRMEGPLIGPSNRSWSDHPVRKRGGDTVPDAYEHMVLLPGDEFLMETNEAVGHPADAGATPPIARPAISASAARELFRCDNRRIRVGTRPW